MNTNELKAATALEQNGAVVIKMAAKGNPDFLVIEKNGPVRFVEVKAGHDKVRPHQQDVHENLRAQGFSVDVLKVEELDKVERCAECGEPVCEDCGACPEESPCWCDRIVIHEEAIEKEQDEIKSCEEHILEWERTEENPQTREQWEMTVTR